MFWQARCVAAWHLLPKTGNFNAKARRRQGARQLTLQPKPNRREGSQGSQKGRKQTPFFAFFVFLSGRRFCVFAPLRLCVKSSFFKLSKNKPVKVKPQKKARLDWVGLPWTASQVPDAQGLKTARKCQGKPNVRAFSVFRGHTAFHVSFICNYIHASLDE